MKNGTFLFLLAATSVGLFAWSNYKSPAPLPPIAADITGFKLSALTTTINLTFINPGPEPVPFTYIMGDVLYKGKVIGGISYKPANILITPNSKFTKVSGIPVNFNPADLARLIKAANGPADKVEIKATIITPAQHISVYQFFYPQSHLS